MTATTKKWVKGLISVIINGAASGVILVVAEPDHFNFGDGLGKLVSTAGIFALLGLANYLKASPLPDDEPL